MVSTKIWGNCGMCKKTIEKAGNKKRVALIVWNKETKLAQVSYDSTKTTLDSLTLSDMKKVKITTEKVNLHPRNKHRFGYDFEQLIHLDLFL